MQNSPFCVDEAGEVPEASLVLYRDALILQGVPVQHRGYYERWVRSWLAHDLMVPSGDTPAQVFSSYLEKTGVPDWQCRQAYQAVRIWSALVMPETPQPELLGWEEVLNKFEHRLIEQQYSPRTIDSYLDWGRRFASRNTAVPTDSDSASAQAQEFMRSLVHERNLSPASLALARNALAWLIKRVLGFELVLEDKGNAHHSRRLPTVLAPSSVHTLLSGCPEPWDLFFRLQYGCGLRLAELLDLRIQEIDLHRGVLLVRSGKGDKDRQVALPPSLRERVEQHLARRHAQWKLDLEKGYAKVDLPFALGRKMTGADTSWEWQHVFGSTRPLRHPETGELRRWHPMADIARNVLKKAAKSVGIEGRVHPHLLRHCYATHMLEAGVSIREIQDLMGHARIETTMVYMHVRSPSAARPGIDLLRQPS
jgi:integron integrase